MTPVVVLNMHYSGLGAARNLAPHGIPVYGFSATDFPGNRSRYVEFRRSPDSLLEPEGLRAFLLDFAREIGDRPILIPTRDHDLRFIDTHREQLEAAFEIPMPDHDTLERVMNKDDLFEVARRCGLALPHGVTVACRADLEASRNSLRFPVIVKPVYARQWRQPGIWEAVGRQKAAYVADYGELTRFYANVEPHDPLMTVQEYVPGPESSLVVFGSYAGRDGRVRAYFTGRKLLQTPPLRGTGVIVEGRPIPEIVEPSRRLLAALGFFGISEIEYKIHEETRVPYLIEINPRHWDQHRLGTACGVNLTLALYQDLTEPDSTARVPVIQRPDPVRWIAENEFALHCLSTLTHPDRSLKEAARLVGGRRTFAVLDRRDPLPGFFMIGSLVREIAAAGVGRLARRSRPDRA